MTERAFFQARALEIAERQAQHFLETVRQLEAPTALHDLVALVQDCVLYLDLPARAVELALALHRPVQRWSAWASWDPALDLLTALDGALVDPATRGRLLLQRAENAWRLGALSVAQSAASEALAAADARGDHHLAAEAFNICGLVALHSDDLAAAGAAFERAYQLGQRVLPALELGHICLNLGTIAMHRNDLRAAHEYVSSAEGHYRVAEAPVEQAKAHCNAAEILRREGRPPESLQLLLGASETFRALHARYDYGLAQNDLGCVYLSLGQSDAAHVALTTAIQELRAIGSLSGEVWVLPNLAELYVTIGDWERAETTLREARALAEVCGRPLIAAAVDVDWGKLLAAQGDHVGARQLWSAALAVQEAKGAKLAAAHTRTLLDQPPRAAAGRA